MLCFAANVIHAWAVQRLRRTGIPICLGSQMGEDFKDGKECAMQEAKWSKSSTCAYLCDYGNADKAGCCRKGCRLGALDTSVANTQFISHFFFCFFPSRGHRKKRGCFCVLLLHGKVLRRVAGAGAEGGREFNTPLMGSALKQTDVQTWCWLHMCAEHCTFPLTLSIRNR